jgi:hypothetical protein
MGFGLGAGCCCGGGASCSICIKTYVCGVLKSGITVDLTSPLGVSETIVSNACTSDITTGVWGYGVNQSGYSVIASSVSISCPTTRNISILLHNTNPNLACLPGCVCQLMPSGLSVTAGGIAIGTYVVCDTFGCHYEYGPYEPCQGIFKTCELQYGPTPPEFADFEIGPSCYLSTTAFTDAFSNLQYRYLFGCDGVLFILSRLFLASDVTTAFRDSSDYQWVIGLSGNTCSPFLLSNGTIYQGGNPACQVTVMG